LILFFARKVKNALLSAQLSRNSIPYNKPSTTNDEHPNGLFSLNRGDFYGPFPYYSKSLFGVVIFFFVLAGCASVSKIPSEAASQQFNYIEEKLRAEAKLWQGTLHRLGGTNRSGIDCSGLAMKIYEKLFGLQIPRTTEEQVRTGVSVSMGQLQAGDLVFFLLSDKKRHVGIYLNKGEFVHASKSKGVIVSNLNDRYWRETYRTARRIIY